MAAARTIIVAGAGIGGLTAALSLAAKGFRVIVLEKAERLEEAGAGLQLSPNASRILVDLGLKHRRSQPRMDLLGMFAQQMCPEDSIATVFDKDFESGVL